MNRINSILCSQIDEDIHSVKMVEQDLPDPGPGEVQVRVKACAVNFPDILMIQGKSSDGNKYNTYDQRQQNDADPPIPRNHKKEIKQIPDDEAEAS